MSVVVTVAGIAATGVGVPIFSGICTAAAASLGLHLLDQAERAHATERREAVMKDALSQQVAAAEQIEVSVATEVALAEVVAERCSLQFSGPNITLTVQRDIRGAMTITAHGEGISKAEVSRQAEALLGKIRQQLAYRQIVQKMKQHGFQVDTESQQTNGTVRVHIRKKRSS